ncbi:DUF5682 family protein [Phycicoccus flavus]|uniref:Uncharacterized protein n=1 Tax=Phycicoccus flavus TaxID=2502783 RepID=A0A8T6R8Y9_9MICO|nr:DUF5682 family protein [Phycicoccus flavus]NHA69325.1 hypothetical protein [Phycicoccus flavus]
MTVHVLGVRHHGPGSARSVVLALEEVRPATLVVEGPPELDAVVPLLADAATVPPVAGLVYDVAAPRRSLFYPLADFSPEWVAIRWALSRGVPVRFADLAGRHLLAPEPATGDTDDEAAGRLPFGEAEEPGTTAPDQSADGPEAPGSEESPDGSGAPEVADADVRQDVVAVLARTAGYADPERWWEDAVEQRHADVLARFAHLRDAIAAVRAADPALSDAHNDRREASMRTVLRDVLDAGDVAVVCGAFHAPALDPRGFPSAAADARLLRGLPRTKVAATWVPWTSARLAASSGYGAGVEAPGWYRHLFETWSTGDALPDPRARDHDVASSWLVRVARALREEGLPAPPASVVDAVRLAESLAAVRGRPAVGLDELTDATRGVLTEGADLPLAVVHRRLVVGEEIGEVPAATPMVPLAADLAARQRSLRLKPTATSSTTTLDLRTDNGRARSVLLHRLRALGVPWGTPADDTRTLGTFKEVWELEWQPELAVAVVDASRYGATVLDATEARVAERAREAEGLAELGRLVETCLVADLPVALGAVVDTLAEATAHQHDLRVLLETVEPLARTVRYGDVRRTDSGRVGALLTTVLARARVGLRAGCQALDDDLATRTRIALESAHRGVALLADPQRSEPWFRALAGLVADGSVHGTVDGRAVRLLHDAGRVDTGDVAARMSRRLSLAGDPADGAAWLESFLGGEAVLLHDHALLEVVDGWVSGIGDDVFADLLPVLRRTFSGFGVAERRRIGAQLAGASRTGETVREVDDDRALPAVLAVARMLGLEVAS